MKFGTQETRDLTRIERIGAHSHIRGIINIDICYVIILLLYIYAYIINK